MNMQRELIYPYIVPGSWVEYASQESLVCWRMSDEVWMVLVFDGDGSVRNVRPQDLAELGIDAAQAFDLAARNLAAAGHAEQFSIGCATLQDGTEIGCVRGNWMAPAAGLMFGHFHAALCERFGGTEFAAVAVNQECLFAFPTDEKTLSSASLRTAIDDEFTGHRKPISRAWLLLDGQWPRAWPGQQAF